LESRFDTATLNNCTVSGNSALYGGGVLTSFGSQATLTGCNVSGNSAYYGGGLWNTGTSTLANCTVSGNSAGKSGGGLIDYAGPVTLTNCTVSGNTASKSGAGLYSGPYAFYSAAFALTNTIVAGNANTSAAASDIINFGGSTTGTNNLIGTGGSGGLVNGASGNLVGVANVLLAPLGNYGGPTETMPLLPGSPAIDAGSNALAVDPATNLPLTTDQRGFARIVGGTVDIGAYEVQASTITLASSADPSTLNQPATSTATVEGVAGLGTPTGTVTFSDGSTTLGTVTLDSNGQADFTTSALSVGNHTITAIYQGSVYYLPSTAGLTQQIHYQFGGFLPPLDKNFAIGIGRNVSIKFQLTDYNGNFISSLNAITSLQVSRPGEASSLTATLSYDPIANQFVANWKTKGLLAGTYTISVALADGTVKTKVIQLSASSSSAGLMANGTASTTATGALLGGDIDLFVDNSNGDLTADELARIQDAVSAVDAVTQPYGVAVMEATDPTAADVTLNMDITSAVGGYADGVLGCTTDAGQITIISGWNFYASSDATQIGSAQYDFQTVVTHELGHALGLGHSANSASVMFATLNIGTTNRALAVADLNVPDTDTTGACGLHATPTQSLDFSSASASVLGMLSGVPERTQASLSADSRHTGLCAVLADWPTVWDFSDSSAHLLNDTPSLLSRLSQPTNDDQDAFWSSLGAATVLEKIDDLSGHLGN
jgi:hypothetical protein